MLNSFFYYVYGEEYREKVSSKSNNSFEWSFVIKNILSMKFLKRIINALILASIGIILYLLFSVYSSDSNEIHNGIIIIYIIGIIISLTTIRIAIKNVGLFQKLTVLFAMISILLSSILFFNRLSVNALWNYTLITFLITISFFKHFPNLCPIGI